MRRVCKWTLVFGVAMLMAGPALAQGQFKGKGRGFGMGGAGLLQNKSVQTELKLTEDQAKKVDEVVQEVRDKHREDFQGLQDLDPQERFQKMAEIGRTVLDETLKGLEGTLSADQVKRFKQIELQNQRNMAFANPKVAEQLKLTDDQKEKIRTIGDDARQEIQSLFQGGGGFGSEENRKKMAEIQKDTMTKISAVLSDDQKKTWKELTGAPFEVKFEGFPGGKKKG